MPAEPTTWVPGTPFAPLSTKYFVWLHVPKTGGRWLQRVLCEHAPPEWELRGTDVGHIPLRLVAGALKAAALSDRTALPVLATCRDPWDWYVSYYFWMEMFKSVGGVGDFRSYWDQHVSHGCTVEGFRKGLPAMVQAPPEWFTLDQMHFLVDASGRFVTLISYESLRVSVLATLTSVVGQVPEGLVNALSADPPFNVTWGRPVYGPCYDDESRKLVERHAAKLIDAQSYRFVNR